MYTSAAQEGFLVLVYSSPGRIDSFMGIYIVDSTFYEIQFQY